MAGFSIPIQGMSRASADFDRAASNIARASLPAQPMQKEALPEDTVDLSTSMVNLLQAKNDYSANTKTVHVMDEMTQTLLDMVG
jgi:flagellar hook protein FlgE